MRATGKGSEGGEVEHIVPRHEINQYLQDCKLNLH